MSEEIEFEWLVRRQSQYDARAKKEIIEDRTSLAAMNLHKRIVAEIDKLPRSEGGLAVYK